MNIAIVTNLNGIGLQRDTELISAVLKNHGHECWWVQWDQPLDPEFPPEYDLAIFLEIVPRDKIALAKTRWMFANPEWVKPGMVQPIRLYIEKIFAKTYEGERVLSKVFPGKVHYTGFPCRDQLRIGSKQLEFLHVGGNSTLRGTQACIDAWKWEKDGKKIPAALTVISTAVKPDQELPENVSLLANVDEEHLRYLQNSRLIHLQPSGTEGFGHALHEAMTANAMIVTTNAPPMNEIHGAYKIRPSWKTTYNLADVYHVSALDIHNAALEALKIAPQWIDGRVGFNPTPREEAIGGSKVFEERFLQHFEEKSEHAPAPRVQKKTTGLTIAFLGNFESPESTENMVKWALDEKLGHTVWTIEEKTARIGDLELAMHAADLFLWVKTPGWLQVSDERMLDYLQKLSKRGIPSVSLHLDKFWGIPEREPQIGRHPFWLTDFVFTADGSRKAALQFRERGVNHHWMEPAVSEVYCHPGTPRTHYLCSVGFVGASDYHREYPFRKELLDFLSLELGNDFQHIQGVRGHELNDFYASCKIVVGDCIFSGLDHYWSDRVPETCGRGGFLLHPDVEGLSIPVARFAPQNLEDLAERIRYYLAHEDERREIRERCIVRVGMHHTWTFRMREILGTVIGDEVHQARV